MSALNTIPQADLWDFLFERQDKPFADDQVIFKSPTTDEVRTYAGLRSAAQNFGTNLKAQWSWKKGDVLLVFSPNSIDIPALLWGCHWAEGVVSPANPAYSVDEFKYQIVDSEAKAMAVHSSCLTIALSAAKLTGFPLDRILVFGEESASGQGLRHIYSMMQDGTPGMTRTSLSPASDPAYLVYSSGTTGRPKGAMVTHLNVVASMVLQKSIESSHMDRRTTRLLALLPMYHIYGLVCQVHFPVYMGIQTTVMQKFSVSAFSEYVRNDAITHVYVAPPVVLYLANDPGFKREDLVSLKMLTSGGAPLAPDLIRAVYERFNIPVRQAFGLTETTAVCHIQRWNQWDKAMGSNGPPLDGVEVKFVDENDNLITEGEGELCMRGPTIFRGYHKNQAATEKALTPDGWFKTGDIGYQDKDGNLYITDRLKDLIKFKGYQVPPTEIEGVLHEHPLVDDVSVIGVFNQDIVSEVPLAYVVLKKTVKPSIEVVQQLISHVANRLAPSKRLRGGIIWTDQIPRSGSGKILKRVLKDKAETEDNGKAVGAMVYDKFVPAKL
ncbi:AMP-binding enzyme [Aspergillus sclerotialis]|uniref:AMP-binding enzyme n=1 Tax=Aspergillus sclerotialis TaxID=2070753 RepID=A0A3A2ZB62_9EURO|nr:AMP-binding enzyme [Aspergillus sclerotialis]